MSFATLVHPSCSPRAPRATVVSEVLGHAGIAITKDVYGHLLEGDHRTATEAISTALLGKQPPVAPKVAPTAAEDTG
ncbi:hypothetical protein [Nonomuraea sp. NPDC049709]|uniref:hypothetical protein n=1 Tax=Nonomuraea sp. NPDC049709 TaxID=3154736 RepID=UPI003414CC8F